MSDATPWEDFYFSSRDDLKLYARKYGWHHHDHPCVVCLPGLTRNVMDFHGLAVHLSEHPTHPRRVFCVDYRGRGNSAYDPDWNNYNPIMESEDLVAGLAAAGVEEVSIVGTSRGGLIAMILMASKPSMIKSVVLNDVGPEIDAKGLLRIKSYMERSKPVSSREEAIASLKDYSSAQFPDMPDSYWEKQVDSIFEVENGSYVARYDRKLLNTLNAINLDAPLVALWPQFIGLTQIPVMLLRGSNTDLLSMETVQKMQELHPALVYREVAGQGHAPDLDTEGVAEAISEFLAKSA